MGEYHVDILALTETWLLSDGDPVSEADLTMNGKYQLTHVPRPAGRGGGVGLITMLGFIVHKIECSMFTTFELMGCNVKCDHFSVDIYVLYRPCPNAINGFTMNMFLSEFSDLVSHLIANDRQNPFFILGDFNIHLNVQNNPSNMLFHALLDDFNLVQHVREPTHTGGHCLDGVVTTSDNNLVGHNAVTVVDVSLSDHYLVYFSLSAMLVTPRRFNTVTCRNIKGIVSHRFSHDILCAFSGIVLDDLECVDLYNLYYCKLLNILDTHAPSKERHIRDGYSVWYTDEISEQKRKRRQLERQWRKCKSIASTDIVKEIL